MSLALTILNVIAAPAPITQSESRTHALARELQLCGWHCLSGMTAMIMAVNVFMSSRLCDYPPPPPEHR
ncbi:uncharacterized protein LAESUDRAFT_721962 [Laetiporus sulphureus 93-53]|uniref:Uncharacterized protein n=1 Tax=Laetiporus sulphureus 93-53 TaxID=1314785 RepID=A0A165GN09_9APHY|nr:uncharacterized protein LAESUDRAFT_721962 [Laetiporus sulphureus 93-53]KZT10573.1 hypothetical protein LAESUDRAFT_721962 [Laetiporus sulphureus 93-53]